YEITFTKKIINSHRARAQCYPRHACPLCGSVLMQVHEHAGGTPALAALKRDRGGKRMQFDATTHAGLKKAENREETQKKLALRMPVFSRYRKGDITQGSPIM
ncbi:hypothetical protein, partial [Citrobacter freundii]|uniref:hypothetical protein n=1 Tax=Citrobacter freundii TaxID=546 RepID=UPI003A96D142